MKLAAAVLWSGCACGAPPGEAPLRPTLFPDVGGRPTLVAISANSARRTALQNADMVKSLVDAFPRSTKVILLTNDRAALTVTRTDQPNRIRFVDVPFEHQITIWPQDPFVVLAEPAGAGTLLTAKQYERTDDAAMANAVAWEAAYSVQASSLFFDGGNIVSDREHVFIGADTIRRNALELGVPEPDVIRRFEEELGRQVLIVGPAPQPLSRIDLALTPLGRRRVAIADAAAGARIAERALQEDPGAAAAFEELTGFRVRTREMIERSRTIAPRLDAMARSLAQHGYRVERIPLLVGGSETGAAAADGDRAVPPAYPMLSFNNVVIEDDADGMRVYLPRYGWPVLDEAARRAWEALGFSTQPIDGLTTSAMHGGALRSTVKVLAR
jgi:hypothetical protein